MAAFDGVGAGDRFGASVALSRELVVIGARGYVSLYKCENQTHIPLTVLSGAGDFGASVAVDGVVVVGAPSENQVVVYQENGTLVTTLTANGASNLGAAVAVHGSIIVAGADEDDEQRGAVYMWRDYEFIGRLQAHDAQPGDRLGVAVAIGGSVRGEASLIAAGAPHRRGSGAVVVFDTEGDIKADFGMGSIGDDRVLGSCGRYNNYYRRAGERREGVERRRGLRVRLSSSTKLHGARVDRGSTRSGRLVRDVRGAGARRCGRRRRWARRGRLERRSCSCFQEERRGVRRRATLTESDPEADDGFGGAVAAFGNWVVVGGSQPWGRRRPRVSKMWRRRRRRTRSGRSGRRKTGSRRRRGRPRVRRRGPRPVKIVTAAATWPAPTWPRRRRSARRRRAASCCWEWGWGSAPGGGGGARPSGSRTTGRSPVEVTFSDSELGGGLRRGPLALFFVFFFLIPLVPTYSGAVRGVHKPSDHSSSVLQALAAEPSLFGSASVQLLPDASSLHSTVLHASSAVSASARSNSALSSPLQQLAQLCSSYARSGQAQPTLLDSAKWQAR